MYVIYQKETTYQLTRKHFKTAGAAKAHLTREVKKAALKLAQAEYFQNLYNETEGDYSAAYEGTKEHFGITKKFGRVETNLFLAERDLVKAEDYAIADAETFYNSIEKQVERTNMMSGETFTERANTPHYCSPASESYWSM